MGILGNLDKNKIEEKITEVESNMNYFNSVFEKVVEINNADDKKEVITTKNKYEAKTIIKGAYADDDRVNQHLLSHKSRGFCQRQHQRPSSTTERSG